MIQCPKVRFFQKNAIYNANKILNQIRTNNLRFLAKNKPICLIPGSTNFFSRVKYWKYWFSHKKSFFSKNLCKNYFLWKSCGIAINTPKHICCNIFYLQNCSNLSFLVWSPMGTVSYVIQNFGIDFRQNSCSILCAVFASR